MQQVRENQPHVGLSGVYATTALMLCSASLPNHSLAPQFHCLALNLMLSPCLPPLGHSSGLLRSAQGVASVQLQRLARRAFKPPNQLGPKAELVAEGQGTLGYVAVRLPLPAACFPAAASAAGRACSAVLQHQQRRAVDVASGEVRRDGPAYLQGEGVPRSAEAAGSSE